MDNNLVNNIDNVRDPEFLIWVRNKIQENPGYSQYNMENLYQAYLEEKNILQNDGNNSNSNENANIRSTVNTRRLINGHIYASSNPMPRNEFRGNVNWYGIILTLVFSFAIGYLIAWIIFNAR